MLISHITNLVSLYIEYLVLYLFAIDS